MLEELRKEMKTLCNGVLGDYTKYTIDDLANKYCDALDTNDSYKKDIYISALILRFWSKIGKLYNECKSLNKDYTDFYDIIVNAIMLACDPTNRAWQNKAIKAESVINQIIATRGKAALYYEANLDKNKANINTADFDAPIYNDGENDQTLADILEADSGFEKDSNCSFIAENVIQECINNGKVMEAVIADIIAFNKTPAEKYTTKQQKYINTWGEEISYSESYHEFSKRILVKNINNISVDKYMKYFKTKYTVDELSLSAVLEKLKKSDNQKLGKYIDRTLPKLAMVIG